MSDEDIDFEFESDGGFGSGDESDDEAVTAQNLYYEAEDERTANPHIAVEKFLSVVRLEKEREQRTGIASPWTLKALMNVVVICAKEKQDQKLLENYPRLLALLPKATWNEALDVIDTVLDAVAGGLNNRDAFPVSNGDYGSYNHEARDNQSSPEVSIAYLKTIYGLTLESLKGSGHTTLWFSTCIKLAKLHVALREVDELRACLKQLYAACEPELSSMTDTTVSTSLSAKLFEVYALDTQLCLMTGDLERMRSVYRKTLQAASTVADPRTIAAMYMADKKWDLAYGEFFEAFKNYQEIGSSTNAKYVLKLVALANLLSLSSIDPFASREAAVFQDDPEISDLRKLRAAFDKQDNETVVQLLTDPSHPIVKDPQLRHYVTDLLYNIRLQLLEKSLTAFQSVRISSLANSLGISETEVTHLLVKLIIDEKIKAELDDLQGIVYVLGTMHHGDDLGASPNSGGKIILPLPQQLLKNFGNLHDAIARVARTVADSATTLTE